MSAEEQTEAKIRINELKYQIKDLNIQLQFALERNRAGKLEDELVDTLASIDRIIVENAELELRRKSLQNQLIQVESSKGVPSNPISNLNEHIDLISELTIMDDGTREKEMEQLYIKAKKDREKAVKLLIHLIGKDKITDYLDDNVGHHDLLDRLYEGIMTKHIDLREKPKKSNTPVASPSSAAKGGDVSRDSILSQSPSEIGKKSEKELEDEFIQVPRVPERHKTMMVKSGKSIAGAKGSPVKNDKRPSATKGVK